MVAKPANARPVWVGNTRRLALNLRLRYRRDMPVRVAAVPATALNPPRRAASDLSPRIDQAD